MALAGRAQDAFSLSKAFCGNDGGSGAIYIYTCDDKPRHARTAVARQQLASPGFCRGGSTTLGRPSLAEDDARGPLSPPLYSLTLPLHATLYCRCSPKSNNSVWVYTYVYAHPQTHTYIYIYTVREPFSFYSARAFISLLPSSFRLSAPGRRRCCLSRSLYLSRLSYIVRASEKRCGGTGECFRARARVLWTFRR